MRTRRRSWKNLGIGWLLALAGLGTNAGWAGAQDIETGQVITFEETVREFEVLAPRCLEYCIEISYQETRFECAPQLAPPLDGCDLPWIDPSNPTPDPFGQGLQCVPSESEFVGYGLLESNALVTEVVHHRANCTTTKQMSRRRRPRTNNPPARDCPDEHGPWVDTRRSTPTYRFVPCRSGN